MSKNQTEDAGEEVFSTLVTALYKTYDLDAVIIAGIKENAETRMCGIMGKGKNTLATIGLIIYQLAEKVNKKPSELAEIIYELCKEADKEAEELTKPKGNFEEVKKLFKDILDM